MTIGNSKNDFRLKVEKRSDQWHLELNISVEAQKFIKKKTGTGTSSSKCPSGLWPLGHYAHLRAIIA
jgi:hypothetical protein